MTKGAADPHWQPFDKRWAGIMEWQVQQKGNEEGRRGWCLVRPERKMERLEAQQRARERERELQAEMARRKKLQEEQWWMEHAEAEGYQFLHFSEDDQGRPSFDSPLAGRPKPTFSPPAADPNRLDSAEDVLAELAQRPGTARACALSEKTRETVASWQSKETTLSQEDTVQHGPSEEWSRFSTVGQSASVVFDGTFSKP
jgi:hypothetical protein